MSQTRGQWAVTIACSLIAVVALTVGHKFWQQVLVALAGMGVLVVIVAVIQRRSSKGRHRRR